MPVSSATSDSAASASQRMLDLAWFYTMVGPMNSLDAIQQSLRTIMLRHMKQVQKFVKELGPNPPSPQKSDEEDGEGDT